MAEASKKRDPRTEGASRYGPALEKAYQFVLWLISARTAFPFGESHADHGARTSRLDSS